MAHPLPKCFLLAVLLLAGCDQKQSGLNGYVEGEYLRIAPTSAGVLETLSVERGDQVAADQPLFSLNLTRLQAERSAAGAELMQAMARMNDLNKGKRPEELEVIRKQKTQAEADLHNAEKQLSRSQPLAQKGYMTKAERDIDLAAFEKAKARVAELDAQLATAALGGREDEIAASEGAVAAARQKLLQAEKLLAEASPKAVTAGRIEEVFYRPGEFVAAGAPVISMLPPENIKIRFFVPEKLLSRIQPGMGIKVNCDGCPAPVSAKVVFISSQAEYTPPVIYSVGSRDKLVFMIEAKPDAVQLALHPGLPVDIALQVP